MACCTGLSSAFAADEVLEEVIVSGAKDPRSGSLISSGSSRLVSPTDIVAPAFSADCVETLEEIQEEIREGFLESGGEMFTYIPCLNDRNDHIFALGKIIENELMGWL